MNWPFLALASEKNGFSLITHFYLITFKSVFKLHEYAIKLIDVSLCHYIAMFLA